MELRTAVSPRDVKHYTTERLREEFLIQNLMHLIVEDSSSYILILYHRFLKMLMNFKISENVDAFIF